MAEQTQAPDFEHLDADQLLDRLIATRCTIAKLQAEDDAMLDRLDELASQGLVDQGGFTHNDYSFFWSRGKCTYAYPDEVEELAADARAAKEAAKADGTATAAIGKPFWTIKPPKKP
jgi:hypothetical protein